jgi:hypothetical protein
VILDGMTGCLVPVEPGPAGAALRPESRRVFVEQAARLLDDPARARALGAQGAQAVAFLTRHYPFAPIFLNWLQSVLEPGRPL